MNRVALNRRRFLKAVGATALTYPFLRGVPSYAAGNNGGTNPTYLVLLFTPNGCVRYRWGAQGPAPTSLDPMATAVTQGLTFRPTLSAFTKAGPSGQADLTKYVTVLDGLMNKAAGTGTHEPGMASLWTGLKADSGGSFGSFKGPSIDQAIASQLGASTPLPSVGLVVQSTQDYYQSRTVDNRMLYDLSGNMVDPIASTPDATVTQIFGQQMAMAMGPSKRDFIRQQVNDHINADLTALQGRLCTEDKQQLQNLQALWNQVQTQLKAAAAQAASCMRPSTTAPAQTFPGPNPTNDPFPTYAAVMPNILAMTLLCNMTQVASFQYSQALSPIKHTWLGSAQTDTHHNLSHQGPSSFYSLLQLPASSNDIYQDAPASIASQYPQGLVDVEAWYAQQVANLAYTLSQFGPSGSTLLDQSIICWGSEIDMGAAHNHDDTPFVLVGGGGGKLKCTTANGLLVRFPLNLTQSSVNTNMAGIRSHNDLLITLAQMMGVSTDQLAKAYGASWPTFNSYVTGPITEILSA